MARTILVIQGHPDPAGGHLCHALADAYIAGAREAGHRVEVLDLAHLDIPFLRTQQEFEYGSLPETLMPAREAVMRAEHYVIIFPLWLGTMPALLKAFLEHIIRPGIAFLYQEKAMPRQLLKGRSARIIVTMGMPAFIYRWVFLAHGVKVLERGILKFVGISPVRTLYIGGIGAPDKAPIAAWIKKIHQIGTRGE